MTAVAVLLGLALALAGAMLYRAHRTIARLQREFSCASIAREGRFVVRYRTADERDDTVFHRGDNGARARDVYESLKGSSIRWVVLEFVDGGVVRSVTARE